MADLAAFEQHMIDRYFCEAAAHGQPGMPRADYHCSDEVDRSVSLCCGRCLTPPQFTTTVTFVGLVTMS